MSHSKRLALSSLLTALAVLLSVLPGSIPIGPTRVLPYQHMVNGIAGIILGPAYAVGIAAAAAVLRNLMGVGTIFAFPGGIPGALVVGLFYRFVIRRDLAALTEPLGTALGAIISALAVLPVLGLRGFPPAFGLTAQWQLFLVFFLLSSIPGAVLGFGITVGLRSRGVLARLGL